MPDISQLDPIMVGAAVLALIIVFAVLMIVKTIKMVVKIMVFGALIAGAAVLILSRG